AMVRLYSMTPPQAGLVAHYAALGKQTDLPVMIYHIPGRAAVSVTSATVARIAERLPNLVGVKHAVNDLELVTELLAKLGVDFRIFCGLEALSLPMMAVAGSGTMNDVCNREPGRVP